MRGHSAYRIGAGLIGLVLFAALPSAFGQSPPDPPPLDVAGKAEYHLKQVVGPTALLGSAAWAGVLVVLKSPEEWRLGAAGYGKRLASGVAGNAIRYTFAFGLDSSLHQDPRYFPSRSSGFWPRLGHAILATVVTRKDKGGSTFAAWRFGSAYGAAFLSNQWYPDRLNTAGHGFLDGTGTLGADTARNVVSEFWPDIKKLLHLP